MRGNLPRLDSRKINLNFRGVPKAISGKIELYVKNVELWLTVLDVGPSEIPIKETHTAVEFVF